MLRKTIWTLVSIFLFTNGIAFGQMDNMLKGVVKAQKAQKIKSSDVEFLSGRMLIEIKEVSYFNPFKNGKRRCVQKQTTIGSVFYGRINQNRVKMYLSKPAERLQCEAYTHCPVFDGSSKYVLKRDPNTMKITEIKEYPLQVVSTYLEQDWKWLKEKEQYVVTASQQASGTNTLEGLNIEIKPYKPAQNTDGATLTPLQPAYVLWITGGRDWKLAAEPEQEGTNLRWDDAKEKLMPVNENVSLGIPYEINSPERPEQDGENIYEQLLLRDVKGFDEFLLNPWRAYGISARANRYYKDDGSETKITISVTISLSADVELKPLEPVQEPELTPLEPINDEIPLAPLEPVK